MEELLKYITETKIHIDMMMESDLKGELTDEDYEQLHLLEAKLLTLENELKKLKDIDEKNISTTS